MCASVPRLPCNKSGRLTRSRGGQYEMFSGLMDTVGTKKEVVAPGASVVVDVENVPGVTTGKSYRCGNVRCISSS